MMFFTLFCSKITLRTTSKSDENYRLKALKFLNLFLTLISLMMFLPLCRMCLIIPNWSDTYINSLHKEVSSGFLWFLVVSSGFFWFLLVSSCFSFFHLFPSLSSSNNSWHYQNVHSLIWSVSIRIGLSLFLYLKIAM